MKVMNKEEYVFNRWNLISTHPSVITYWLNEKGEKGFVVREYNIDPDQISILMVKTTESTVTKRGSVAEANRVCKICGVTTETRPYGRDEL